MTEPWLSVVIPSYLGERWIGSSLGSLAADGVPGIEVLLIDGSPNSATRDIARSYLGKLHLRVIERPDLTSWQAKTNFGVEMASSTHISWLGVDDVWLSGRGQSVRSWITASPDTALHIAPSAIIDRKGNRRGTWNCPFPAEGNYTPAFVARRLLVQNFIAAPAPVFRKDAWLSCGGADPRLWYTADWDIWLKLSALGAVTYHRTTTVGFRIHGGSLTVAGSRNNLDFSGQMQTVLERHLGKAKEAATEVERIARVSIAVNAALASGSAGKVLAVFGRVLRLGPLGIWQYLRDSRLMERIVPRALAILAGGY